MKAGAQRACRRTGAGPAIGRRRTSRACALEREATALSRRFLAGGRSLAGAVTTAPAAGFTLPRSTGISLPQPLRHDLEDRFDADLATVRIHNDAHASLAARSFGADAFASGTHVYFADGRFRPSSRHGQELIAHEIVHVLQQTGRAASGGRRASTPVMGSGAVQCNGPETIDEQKGNFKAWADKHRGSSEPSGDADLDAAIDTADKMLGGRLSLREGKPPWGKSFSAAAASGRFNTKSAKARSFVVDCLKWLGFHKEAATLVEADTDFKLRTAGPSEKFFRYLLDDPEFGRGRVAAFLGHKAFSKFWPAAILRGWRQYFLHPRNVPGTDPALSVQFGLIQSALKSGLDESPPTLKAEHYWATWRLIGDLDDDRIRESAELRDRLLQESGKRSIYETLVERIPWLRKNEQKKLDDQATPEYMRTIATGKIAIFDEVLPIWTAAVAAYAKWLDAFRTLTPDQLLMSADRSGLPDPSAIRDAVAPLRAPLVTAAKTLFAIRLDADRRSVPLAADEYQVRLRAFLTALLSDAFRTKPKGEKRSMSGHVDAFLAEEATSAKPDPARLAGFALLPLIFDGVLAIVFSYDVAKDQQAPAFADMREAHRVRLGRAVAFIGRWLGWDDLIETVRPLLLDEEREFPEAQLYLVSDWEPDAVRPIGDLLSDFPENKDEPILFNTPFTATHLVEWFRYKYHRGLRQAMEDILGYENILRADTPLDFKPLEATRQTRLQIEESMAPSAQAEVSLGPADVTKFPLQVPQRFFVREYELLVPPGATVDWLHLLWDHKKTDLQLRRRSPYLVMPKQRELGAFAWALPPIDGLLALMKKIPRIAQLAKDRGIPEARWLAAFSPPENRVGKDATAADIKNIRLTAAEWELFNSTLLKWLRAFNEQQVKPLPGLRRRLVILRRRWLMMNLNPLIEHFAEYPYVSQGPFGESREAQSRRLKTPETAVGAIYAFERFARELETGSDDQASRDAAAHTAEVQTVLLIIGLSPSLLKLRFGSIDGYLKRHLYEFYQLAIDYVSNKEKVEELKAGVGVPDEVAALVFAPDRLKTMKDRMLAVTQAIEQELATWQQQRGYGSEDGKSILPNGKLAKKPIVASKRPDPLYEWRMGQTLGAEGKIDDTTGVLYRLVDVYHKFEFHPHVGSRPVAGLRRGAGGPYSPAWIVIDGKRYDEPDLPAVELFVLAIGDENLTVKANDLAKLEMLDDVFLWRAFSMALLETAAGLETFAQWMVTVVSVFVPEVAMAEFVANLAMMFASGEFDDLIYQLKNDPLELFEKLALELKQRLFRPEDIWRYLILGGQHPAFQALASVLPKRKAKVNATPTTKFGRIVAALKALGRRLKLALERVREYIQPPLRRVQGRIAMHPTLVWLLRRAAHVVGLVLDLIPDDVLRSAKAKQDPQHPVEFVELLKADASSIEQTFRDRVVELFEGIQQFELPDELINLDVATELIVSFLLDRFGPRGKVVRMLMQVMPVPTDWSGGGRGGYKTAMGLVTGEIAKVWRRSDLDPNNVWRSEVRSQIAPKFDVVRDDLVKGMYDLVDGVLVEMGLPKLARPQKSDLPTTSVVDELLVPESEAAFDPANRPRTGRIAINPAGGTPLPRPLRGRLELALGADLSHVRVHAGAAAATAPIGANALTSGSHIFVSPTVSTTSAAGVGLLAHEATHVVQQTGAAGAGGSGARTPTLGRSASGLRIDKEREAVADLVSREVTGGRVLSIALRQPVGRTSGIQPDIGEQVVESVLDTLSTTKSSDFTKSLEGGRTPEGWNDAKVLADALFVRLRGMENIKFVPFLKDTVAGEDIARLVQAYLRELTDKFPEMELKRIAALAQKPRTKKSKDDPDTELHPKGFVQLLGNYIYATRHVALKIETDAPVKKITGTEIFNLNLAGVGGGAKLWALAMKASFGTNPAVGDLKKAQAEIRERLRNLQGDPSIWDSKHFRFAQWLIDDYVALLKARAAGKVSDVPPVEEYIKTKSTAGSGLAVSTHGDLTKRGIGAFDRESHHTTQYLLVEFFGNQPDGRQAFPKPYEDFTFPAPYQNRLKLDANGTIDAIEGSEKLEIKPLNPTSGRGEGMPTILLSARCHQRGNLHVLREYRWVDSTNFAKEMHGTMTQGLAIENAFNRAITDPDLRPRDTSDDHRKKLKKKIETSPLTASQQYYNAALATYKWMRDRMIPALQGGLLSEEKAYYRGIAARDHSEGEDKLQPKFDLQDAHLMEVYATAVKNNDEVMAKYKWKA